jgi:hypothetical protein
MVYGEVGEMKHPQAIAVDLDGVLAEYDHWQGKEHIGPPISGAHLFLTELRLLGFTIIIHTSRRERGALDYVRVWLNQNDMPYDEVWDQEGKPLAVAYVDDRAVECRPQGRDSYGFIEALDKIRFLSQVAK